MRVINVEGIPGSGKTTLVRQLSSAHDVHTIYEPVKENPFLDRFYADPRRHAFTMQMWLLAKRNAANTAAFWLSRAGADVIVDRGRLGDKCFALVNHRLGNMTDDEMLIYDAFFETMDTHDPDTIIFLDIDEGLAMERIAGRGRECEKSIDIGYLRLLRSEHQRMVEGARARGVGIMIMPTIDEVVGRLQKVGQK